MVVPLIVRDSNKLWPCYDFRRTGERGFCFPDGALDERPSVDSCESLIILSLSRTEMVEYPLGGSAKIGSEASASLIVHFAIIQPLHNAASSGRTVDQPKR